MTFRLPFTQETSGISRREKGLMLCLIKKKPYHSIKNPKQVTDEEQ